jgi:DNA-directed RNA polymerase subunit H (RpoH/RPB5)
MYNIDNIDLLYILYNLIKKMDDRGYAYLGTNYKIINKEKKLYDINQSYKISDYTYIIKTKNNILFKNNGKYTICLFSESFSDYSMPVLQICKSIINYIANNKLWSFIQTCIIICPNDIEIKINRKLKEEMDIFETVPYSKLLYDPTMHIDSIKHEKVKNFENKYKKYNLKLPVLLISDPICKWYGYKIDDIIKITRDDGSIIHRIVKQDNLND